MKYDYLIVGSGLFGSVFAYEMNKRGKKCLVIEKRNHIGGNVYTEEEHNINVHKYGAHIVHTSNKEVWDYLNQFAQFNRFTNSAPIVRISMMAHMHISFAPAKRAGLQVGHDRSPHLQKPSASGNAAVNLKHNGPYPLSCSKYLQSRQRTTSSP